MQRSITLSFYTFTKLVVIFLVIVNCVCGSEKNDLHTVLSNFSYSSVNEVLNYSSRKAKWYEQEKIGVLKQALNFHIRNRLSQGTGQMWRLSAQGNKSYFLNLTPISGDPDLLLYHSPGHWEFLDESVNGEMKVDSLYVLRNSSEDLFISVYAYSDTEFDFSVSWEENNRLELDVPFLNQNNIPVVGISACSSASATMIFAYHAKIRVNNMIPEAEACFAETATLQHGLISRIRLKNYIEDKKDFSSVVFDASNWPSLFSLIQNEIRMGRPLILGTRSMTTAGHYLVVVGFNGNDYYSANLIVNDNNGQWLGYKDGYTSSSILLNGKGLEYKFTTITAEATDGVFVIHP